MLHVEHINMHRINDNDRHELNNMINDLSKHQIKFDKLTVILKDALLNRKKAPDPDEFYYFLKDDNHIAGYASIKRNLIMSTLGMLTDFYIKPEFRHKHFGQYFLIELERIAKRELNMKALGLNCLEGNDSAKNLYQKNNYKPISQYYRKEL